MNKNCRIKLQDNSEDDIDEIYEVHIQGQSQNFIIGGKSLTKEF
jgi:hypothetical protein